MGDDRRDNSGWKWSWNPLTGIMFGPIPVGIIVVIPLLIVLFVVMKH